MENAPLIFLIADDSAKNALGGDNDVMVELHMTCVPIYFIVMDMGSKTSSPIIFGRPFLRTLGAVIDKNQENVKFHFSTRGAWNTFQRRRTLRKATQFLFYSIFAL
jgi:hypothetical protein